ncbi:MAG: histidinol-phosphate aminotransferase family protein [Ardenticatenales bacterium]|nr:histidinol-phosphate aminotransferase family protein [Ardenticatenales bacterium]
MEREKLLFDLNELPAPIIDQFTWYQSTDALHIHRYETQAAEKLIGLIAEYNQLPVECVLLDAGADGILSLIFHYCARQNQSVYLPHPSYTGFPTLAAIAGCTVVPYAVQPHLPQVPDQPPLLICNPDNPSGQLIADLESYIARRNGLTIIDEAYIEFCPAISTIALVREGRPVLLVRTFSKAFGAASIRLGYLLGPAPLIKRMRDYQMRYPVSTLAIEAGIDLWQQRAQMEASVVMIRAACQELQQAFRELGFDVLPSQTNFFACFCPPSVDAGQLCEQLRARNVYIQLFNLGAGKNPLLRITTSDPDTNQKLLQIVASLI